MTFNVARVRHCLQEFQLENLFIEELGWDRHSIELNVTVDDSMVDPGTGLFNSSLFWTILW